MVQAARDSRQTEYSSSQECYVELRRVCDGVLRHFRQDPARCLRLAHDRGVEREGLPFPEERLCELELQLNSIIHGALPRSLSVQPPRSNALPQDSLCEQ